jgi:hypothetical protein
MNIKEEAEKCNKSIMNLIKCLGITRYKDINNEFYYSKQFYSSKLTIFMGEDLIELIFNYRKHKNYKMYDFFLEQFIKATPNIINNIYKSISKKYIERQN